MTNKAFVWIRDNKWLVAGVVIAVFNPIPSGVVLGIVMLTEEKLAKIGKIVLAISIIVVTFLIFIFLQDRSR